MAAITARATTTVEPLVLKIQGRNPGMTLEVPFDAERLKAFDSFRQLIKFDVPEPMKALTKKVHSLEKVTNFEPTARDKWISVATTALSVSLIALAALSFAGVIGLTGGAAIGVGIAAIALYCAVTCAWSMLEGAPKGKDVFDDVKNDDESYLANYIWNKAVSYLGELIKPFDEEDYRRAPDSGADKAKGFQFIFTVPFAWLWNMVNVLIAPPILKSMLTSDVEKGLNSAIPFFREKGPLLMRTIQQEIDKHDAIARDLANVPPDPYPDSNNAGALHARACFVRDRQYHHRATLEHIERLKQARALLEQSINYCASLDK